MSCKFLITAGTLFLCSSMLLCADNPGKAPGKNAAQNAEKSIQTLKKEKQELLSRRQTVRTKLLKNDPRLRRKREQLLRQARLLALELDTKPEIRKINEEIRVLDQKIRKLSSDAKKK